MFFKIKFQQFIFSVRRVYKVDNGERKLFGISLSFIPCLKSEPLQNGQNDNSSNSIEVKYKNKSKDETTEFQTVDEVNMELPNRNNVEKQNKSNGVTADIVSTSADSAIDAEKETGSEGNKNNEKMRDVLENTPFIDSIEDSGEDDQSENKNIPPGKTDTKNVDQSDKTLEGKDNQNDLYSGD